MIDSKVLWLVPILSLIGSGNYSYAVLRGRAKPNRVTWVLWALAPLIAFAAEIHAGVGLQSLLTFMSGFGPLLVVVASFFSHKAVWKLTKFDYVCGGLSILGLALWLITRHGDIAIIFAIMADGLAGLPTIAKSFTNPDSESPLVFMLGAVCGALTLLTVKDWTIANAAFATYIMLVCIVLVLLVRFRLGLRVLAFRRG
jgi:hypothetical protein